MLFMGVCGWEPGDRDKVRKALAGEKQVTGVKTISTWSDIGGCRSFRLFEADDTKAMVAALNPWTDIASIEIIPVIESQEVLKVAASQK